MPQWALDMKRDEYKTDKDNDKKKIPVWLYSPHAISLMYRYECWMDELRLKLKDKNSTNRNDFVTKINELVIKGQLEDCVLMMT